MPGKPVLIDKFLEDAIELDVDCLSDGETSVIGGMLEHIEYAGVHSGDAAMVMPPHTLGPEMLADGAGRHARAREGAARRRPDERPVRDQGRPALRARGEPARLAHGAVRRQGDRVPLAKLAAKVMAGMKLAELGFTRSTSRSTGA
jgi:carbamoyl-phosphate synthase large subunit